MKLIILLLVISITSTFAQTDFVKWGKADYSYAMPAEKNERDFSLDEKNVGGILLKSAADAYWFFISDVDGDNCSFSPTCSNFLLQSVHKTNLVQGSLMFFDRFTRDMDVLGKFDNYPRVKDGHYYDPPSLYMLSKNKIKYLPPYEVVSK